LVEGPPANILIYQRQEQTFVIIIITDTQVRTSRGKQESTDVIIVMSKITSHSGKSAWHTGAHQPQDTGGSALVDYYIPQDER